MSNSSTQSMLIIMLLTDSVFWLCLCVDLCVRTIFCFIYMRICPGFCLSMFHFFFFYLSPIAPTLCVCVCLSFFLLYVVGPFRSMLCVSLVSPLVFNHMTQCAFVSVLFFFSFVFCEAKISLRCSIHLQQGIKNVQLFHKHSHTQTNQSLATHVQLGRFKRL